MRVEPRIEAAGKRAIRETLAAPLPILNRACDYEFRRHVPEHLTLLAARLLHLKYVIRAAVGRAVLLGCNDLHLVPGDVICGRVVGDREILLVEAGYPLTFLVVHGHENAPLIKERVQCRRDVEFGHSSSFRALEATAAWPPRVTRGSSHDPPVGRSCQECLRRSLRGRGSGRERPPAGASSGVIKIKSSKRCDLKRW